jgi:succinyl-CoA synthetase beta subunit
MSNSPHGGMDIEAVAAATPDAIFKEGIDIKKGVQPHQLEKMAHALGFENPQQKSQAMDIMAKFYKLFTDKDCTLIECNPFAETHDGKCNY